ncbi:hypothetical protein BP5796_11252 [Coleophoma crateriformis]|uniref:Fe2OG dioxygenase domain-containing protein n=1 Tax=Coleophoma crateriformis TaxID=565419 RepID=A0A3D8QI65_9HELO|nr:hypothetical protein BP5796_11252 [Coleophoma crateriformis]
MAPISEPNIPTVDLSAFVTATNEAAKQEAADKLVQVCHRLGFVAITGHGISKALLAEAFAWSKKLFDLPLEEKMKAPHPVEATPHRGYSHPGKEKVYGYDDLNEKEVNDSKGQSLRKIPDFKESYEIGSEDNPEEPNIWLPEEVLPGYREFMVKFYWELNEAATRILNAFAMGMKLEGEEADMIMKLNSLHSNQLRLLHYPEVPREAIENQELARMPAHTDWGSFTLLFQDDCGGLELEDPQNRGTYLAAKPTEGTVLLNIGDFFMRLTNDFFVSATHRVTLPPPTSSSTTTTKPRYSIPYFVSPPMSLIAKALPTYVSEEKPVKYEACSFAEYAAHISKYQYGGPAKEVTA